jgi:hypothetical protein
MKVGSRRGNKPDSANRMKRMQGMIALQLDNW